MTGGLLRRLQELAPQTSSDGSNPEVYPACSRCTWDVDVQAQASRERRRRRIWRGCPSECNWIPHYDGRLASPTAGARAINVLGPEGTLRCTQLAQAVGGMFNVQAQASRERRRRRIWRGCPSECNWIPP